MSKINKFMKMDYANNIILESEEGMEFVFNPYTKYITIGMGGEVWSGYVEIGTNLLRHPRESIDNEYVPVVVYVTDLKDEEATEFKVVGGFGMEATFVIGQNLPRNNFH